MPVYRLDRPGQKPRVVDAKTPAAARAHVAKAEIKVKKIDVAEAFRLANNGIELETAGEDLDDTAKPEPEQPDPDRQRDDKIERDRFNAENPIDE